MVSIDFFFLETKHCVLVLGLADEAESQECNFKCLGFSKFDRSFYYYYYY